MGRKTVGIIASALTEGPGAPGQRVNNRYPLAVAEVAGAVPLLIPALPGTEDIGHLVEILDGIVLTGARPNVHPGLYGAEPSPAYEPYDQGRDAVALGVEKGPRVGELIAAVERWWADEDFQPGREACLAKLEALARQG